MQLFSTFDPNVRSVLSYIAYNVCLLTISHTCTIFQWSETIESARGPGCVDIRGALMHKDLIFLVQAFFNLISCNFFSLYIIHYSLSKLYSQSQHETRLKNLSASWTRRKLTWLWDILHIQSNQTDNNGFSYETNYLAKSCILYFTSTKFVERVTARIGMTITGLRDGEELLCLKIKHKE